MTQQSQLFDDSFSGTVSALVAALGDPTRREIYLFALRAGVVNAPDVARAFALHPNVARHHLDRLHTSGYLETELTSEHPAQVGRPSKRYRPVEHPELLQGISSQTELLGQLLSRFIEELPTQTVERIAYEVGMSFGSELAGTLRSGEAPRSVSSSLQLVADALTRTGFSSRRHQLPVEFGLINRSCPFGSVASDHPVLCATERGIIEGLLRGVTDGSETVVVNSQQGVGVLGCAITIRSRITVVPEKQP
ncbi:MAG: helix-turn-helix transcriptional regulator [Ferrimicrobium sp.]